MINQKPLDPLLNELGTSTQNGLSSEQAAQRLMQNGANVFQAEKPKSKLRMFFEQLNDPMIYILFGAAAVSLILREFSDAVIILAVVLLNAIIGLVQEGKAQKALDSLKKLSSPFALVRRDGVVKEIPAQDLVVGDIVLLDAGRIVPADLRLTSTHNLQIEESALTGESVPVQKDHTFLPTKDVGLGDCVHMAFSSTNVTYGRGEGVVVATGMQTEIGKIASIIQGTPNEMTPLQKRLAELGKVLGILAVVICLAMFGIALLQGRDLAQMLLTAISLAVAAIPEGLPAVVTIVLALGVQRMVKVNTIVRRLPSVETLGAVSVVCSDKTGTLTQNKMTVTRVYTNGQSFAPSALDPQVHTHFLQGFVLCNDASIQQGRIGDPTEIALLDMAAPFSISREGLEETLPRVNELAFDSDRKRMTTVHRTPQGDVIAFTKGAVDGILPLCTHIEENGQVRPFTSEDSQNILAAAGQMARQALRVLALACKPNDDTATEQDLTFVGLVGMIDPPRPEASDAVASFKRAGIRTVMITGDHKDTALAIAEELGIAESESQCMTGAELSQMSQEDLNAVVDNLRVFARVSPEHKVMIVKALQSKGYIVSMTGDGVNDAPSLKTADIGVAMGITGTDVSKDAADMVLTDDNFATIEKAVEEGRSIYQNIKKSVVFLLSSNLGEVVSMFTAIVAGLASPLKAIHILWINLITDSLPGLALGVDPKTKDLMQDPPRKANESLFAHGAWFYTLLYGLVIGLMTLAAFLYSPIRALMSQGLPVSFAGVQNMLADPAILLHAQTYAFVTLGMSQLFHAIGMRSQNRSVFAMNHLENRLMLVAFFVGFGLQVAVTEIPLLTNWFGTCSLSLVEWGELFLFAMVPLAVHEIIVLVKWIHRKAQRR